MCEVLQGSCWAHCTSLFARIISLMLLSPTYILYIGMYISDTDPAMFHKFDSNFVSLFEWVISNCFTVSDLA